MRFGIIRLRQTSRVLGIALGKVAIALCFFLGASPQYKIPGNYRADALARTGALLPESSSIEFGVSLSSVKLVIARNFFRDV